MQSWKANQQKNILKLWNWKLFISKPNTIQRIHADHTESSVFIVIFQKTPCYTSWHTWPEWENIPQLWNVLGIQLNKTICTTGAYVIYYINIMLFPHPQLLTHCGFMVGILHFLTFLQRSKGSHRTGLGLWSGSRPLRQAFKEPGPDG